jgi:uncharacterized protein YigE (DUF2233 family)
VKTLLITGWIATTLLLSNASAMEFSSVEIGGKRVTVCRVNVRKEKLQMFYRDKTGQPYKRFEILTASLQPRGQKLVFAMNGGMYHDRLIPRLSRCGESEGERAGRLRFGRQAAAERPMTITVK